MLAQNRRNIVRLAVLILPLASAISSAQAAQRVPATKSSPQESCRGLHAGIRAQIMGPNIETPNVALSFILLNDSEAPVDVEAGSWRIVVDGTELKDSGFLFGNGPHPEGGYRVLKPGESYEFGKALSIVDYFLPNGEHKVSWRGAGFASSTISVTITPTSH
jgi:hypothetical protein